MNFNRLKSSHLMIFAFTERQKSKDLLAVRVLLLRVCTLHAQQPGELDALQRCEIISLRVLRFQREGFRRLFQVQLACCCVHGK